MNEDRLLQILINIPPIITLFFLFIFRITSKYDIRLSISSSTLSMLKNLQLQFSLADDAIHFKLYHIFIVK